MSYTDEKIQALSYRISDLTDMLRSLKTTGSMEDNNNTRSMNELSKQLECNNQLRFIELQLQLGLMSKEEAKNALLMLKASITPVRKHGFF